MQRLTKKSLCWIGLLAFASTFCFAQPIAKVAVIINHELPTGFESEIPTSGQVLLHVEMFKYGVLGFMSHHVETKSDLVLGGAFHDIVEGDMFNPNPTGLYTIALSCRGIGQFAGQTSSIRTSIVLQKGEKETAIKAFCPSKGSLLATPMFQVMKA
jgi:hypothetical protein